MKMANLGKALLSWFKGPRLASHIALGAEISRLRTANQEGEKARKAYYEAFSDSGKDYVRSARRVEALEKRLTDLETVLRRALLHIEDVDSAIARGGALMPASFVIIGMIEAILNAPTGAKGNK